jgi:predicted membrane protein DUF2339
MALELTHHDLHHDACEQATVAEMKFAGHYLNFFGMFLLVVGIVSYFKSTGASNGLLETMLGAALGLVLLGAGEYFFGQGYSNYSHPLLTGGFCLLFFAVCSGHFRHGLMGQEAMFGWLLLVVVASNASVFRHDSKLIGNVMLTVYFLTPIFMTFSFQNFTTIFLYLLAINLGATVVAFHKRWEFQLTVSALGSYAFYFTHFRTEVASNSLAFLLAVYGLSLVVNYLLYFFQPESGDSNLLLSLVSQVIFIVLSGVVVMGLPNWSRVTLYTLLALVQAGVAVMADVRRKDHDNFVTLATGSLILCLLFVSVSISFVTYFSESTTFFGLVTFLWFSFALVTLELGIRIKRHRRVLGRFSYFGLVLGAAQVMYVLPSMQNSEALQMAGLVMYWSYFTSFFLRRNILEDNQVYALSGAAVAGCFLTVNTVMGPVSPIWATLAFSILAVVFFCVKIECKFRFLKLLPYAMGGAALYSSCFLRSNTISFVVLSALVLVMGGALEYALRHGRKCGEVWFWIGLLAVRIAFLPLQASFSLVLVGLAVVHLLGKLASLWITRGDVLSRTVEIATTVIAAMIFFLDSPPLSTLIAVVSILMLSQVLQFWLDGESSSWDLGLCLILVGVLIAQGYQPYPVACLVIVSLVALGLAFVDTPICVGFQMATACAFLFLPFGIGLSIGLTLVVGVLAATSYRVAQSSSSLLIQASMAGFLLAFLKWTLMIDLGPFSTLCWAGAAICLLYYAVSHEELGLWNECNGGLFDFSRGMYFLAFVKAITFDTNFVGSLQPWQYPCTFLVGALFLASGHLLIRKREVRNLFLVLGLMVCCFQLTFILHSWWGDRTLFQPLLSGFWSAVSLLVIACGINLNLRVYRLFGLVMLVANTAKILLVDIHVLDSYSQTNTYLILGVLLMTTSFLYQRRRAELCPGRGGGLVSQGA